jgi:hypothetical protein
MRLEAGAARFSATKGKASVAMCGSRIGTKTDQSGPRRSVQRNRRSLWASTKLI